ncbi:PIR protein [Plasmodium yoelii]|uniref:PIR protein n=3 Tax=Plasmodium yoelii TaxID=5861 RepID=A0AAF0B2E8_PLAYO|nr:PIR protein [Plasmodium yoelii]EAA15450.1 putative bir1 protein [Plasmodium yoelii yoelii]WBY54615.1 PIR protein [Plasmodium yoelii yoelii]CDS44721.1 YIR protein [Plasmodium yoelii]VTZ71609.1 PIR protein [Plasmodium yoelii]|eukprot:XP_034493336.1 PIR protein [Plasmodium yoelii]
MAISKVCGDFDTFWRFFPDGLKDSINYKFNTGSFKKYCPNNNCDSDIDKINAGCLWLINNIFSTSDFSVDNNTLMDDATCIMIWLGYILNLKPPDNINTLKDFYSKHIEKNTMYTENKVNNQETYIKEVMEGIKEYMDINISYMPKFYELLKLLCNMNSDIKKTSNDVLQYANNFGDEYGKLLNDNENIDGSSYNKLLLVLSRYYTNFGKGSEHYDKTTDFPSLPTKKTTENGEVLDTKVTKTAENGGISDTKVTKTTESSHETDKSNIVTIIPISNTVLSGSSLVNKIIIFLSIFGAIAILGGISYKYSLFGFRKRSQKQRLREKLKK